METKKDTINRIFNLARMQGLCKSQSEFAHLLGMNPSTISKALQGDEKYLTENLVKRINVWASQMLNKEPSQVQQPVQDTRPDIVIPAATMDLYTSMAKSIDRLTSLVERMQPGASAYTGIYGQKNPSLDRK